MRKFYVWLALAGIIAITSTGLGCKSNQPAPVNNTPVVEPPPLSITVTINDGTLTKNYTVIAPVNSSVDAVMEQASTENNLQYSTKENVGLGKFVDSIGGVATNASAKKYWLYAVNGVPTTVSVSDVIVQTGDIISWTYKDFNDDTTVNDSNMNTNNNLNSNQ